MNADKKQFAFINQEFLPLDQAFLHVSDLAIQRGFGVFDYFKVNDQHPFFLDDYLTRFAESARLMGITLPLEHEALKGVIYELLQKNDLGDSGVKMILTGGYSPDGYQPVEPNLLITQQEFSLPAPEQYNRGINIITHEYVREIPTAKTINYTMGIRLIQNIKAKGADDVLYHQKGIVSEFPRCNFFIVKEDNTVTTPAQDVLPGITRKNVLSLAGKFYQAEEGVITLADIRGAKEAFMTSTTKRILPIVQVDDQVIGSGQPGEITRHLLEELISLEEKDRTEAGKNVN
jgi:branched-chain amino acid aminotransferase